MLNKKEFIKAYIALDGGTKENAAQQYDDAIEHDEHEWVYTIIEIFRKQSQLAFYND